MSKYTTQTTKKQPVRKDRTTYEVEMNITFADLNKDSKRRQENERQVEQFGDVLWA